MIRFYTLLFQYLDLFKLHIFQNAIQHHQRRYETRTVINYFEIEKITLKQALQIKFSHDCAFTEAKRNFVESFSLLGITKSRKSDFQAKYVTLNSVHNMDGPSAQTNDIIFSSNFEIVFFICYMRNRNFTVQIRFYILQFYNTNTNQANKMKFGLIALAGLFVVAQSETIGNQAGTYCDKWSPCGADFQCVNKKCAVLKCSEAVACDSGFQCVDSVCLPLQNVSGSGQYCDQWTQCSSTEQCKERKCVPLTCIRDTNCAAGYQCFNGKCVSGTQSSENFGYCDAFTPCAEKDQCVDKKCVPFKCNITPDCAQGYTCHDGQHCIQVNNSHTRGRYCDAENECDILHACVNSECTWK